MQENPKRKYKHNKMLLRSNNDYIDHDYYKRLKLQSEANSARMMEKYGVKFPDGYFDDVTKRPANPNTVSHKVPKSVARRFIEQSGE